MSKKNIYKVQFVEEMRIRKNEKEKTIKNINFDVVDSLLNRRGINNELKNSQFWGSFIIIKSNNNIINSKFIKIFNAIKGDIIELLNHYSKENYDEFLIELFFVKKNEIIDLNLSKIKEQKIDISFIYLFKTIKLSNSELVKKLINILVNV